MYYRGKNNEIIEGYDETPDTCNDNTPLWLIILLIAILVIIIALIIYSLTKK
jgi:hypothetical protein